MDCKSGCATRDAREIKPPNNGKIEKANMIKLIHFCLMFAPGVAFRAFNTSEVVISKSCELLFAARRPSESIIPNPGWQWREMAGLFDCKVKLLMFFDEQPVSSSRLGHTYRIPTRQLTTAVHAQRHRKTKRIVIPLRSLVVSTTSPIGTESPKDSDNRGSTLGSENTQCTPRT